jgi:hypothetical protein
VNTPVPARRERPRLQVVSREAAILDGQWASDHWDASLLGIPARRGRGTARFDGISQPWLRDPVKRWSRFRLATGCAFATIDAGALALTRFSRFLTTRHPQAADASAITRPVLEDYLSWLLTQGYSASTRALSLSMIRVLFDACHRHGWLPGLAASATIYVEELPFHHDEIARFIPEFVMAQLESGEALAKMRLSRSSLALAVSGLLWGAGIAVGVVACGRRLAGWRGPLPRVRSGWRGAGVAGVGQVARAGPRACRAARRCRARMALRKLWLAAHRCSSRPARWSR